MNIPAQALFLQKNNYIPKNKGLELYKIAIF